jgi:hypothetical protein
LVATGAAAPPQAASAAPLPTIAVVRRKFRRVIRLVLMSFLSPYD